MSKTLKFDLTIYPENGGFILTSVLIDLTEEEYEEVLETYKDGYDIGDWGIAENIYVRITEKAVSEFDWENSEYDYNDLGDARYDIEYPDEIIDAAEDSDPSESKRNLIDADEISTENLIDREELVDAFKSYLMENLYYSKSEAELAASDFEDPYETPYIYQEYESTIVLDGINAECAQRHIGTGERHITKQRLSLRSAGCNHFKDKLF